MPANLPPAYKEAEIRFRAAKSPSERVLILEEMMALLPKHKGTDKLRAQLRRRYSALEEEMEKQTSSRRRGKGLPFKVQKEGAGQVHLVGLPNSGKSRLVGSLTNASTTVAGYPYTTHMPVPGMMDFENVLIQLLDLPSTMDEGALSWLPNLLRTADALFMVLALDEDLVTQYELLMEGLREWKIVPYGATALSGLEPYLRPKPTLLIATKADLEGGRSRWEVFREGAHAAFPSLAVSADTGEGLEEIPPAAFRLLDIIRVYTRAPGKKIDPANPLILRSGGTVEDAARSTHKDFASDLRFCRLWGGGKFQGQRVGKDHVLNDGDTLEFHI